MLAQCWANVSDEGPTLKQHWVHVLRLLGSPVNRKYMYCRLGGIVAGRRSLGNRFESKKNVRVATVTIGSLNASLRNRHNFLSDRLCILCDYSFPFWNKWSRETIEFWIPRVVFPFYQKGPQVVILSICETHWRHWKPFWMATRWK